LTPTDASIGEIFSIVNYLQQKELEKWEKGVTMALQDKLTFNSQKSMDTTLLKEVHNTIIKILNPTYTLC
jgi:uncharacterized protein YaaW (UPF0174 family)